MKKLIFILIALFLFAGCGQRQKDRPELKIGDIIVVSDSWGFLGNPKKVEDISKDKKVVRLSGRYYYIDHLYAYHILNEK